VLSSLYIKNYALIDELRVDFARGLNIITGETGAGKSIVLAAFSLLIGERTSADMIRHGQPKAIIEAEFGIAGNPRLKKFLDKHEIEHESDELFVRREVSAKGSSRAFVNDSPVSVQLLRDLGEYLVDLHGQHDHQSLLRKDNHLLLLDDFGGLEPNVEEYQSHRREIIRLEREIEELHLRQTKLAEEHDLYEFQMREIAEVSPRDHEDEEIEQELKVLENSEELRDKANTIVDLLYGESGSAYEKLAAAREELARIARIDASLEEQLKEASSALAIVEELEKSLARYAEHVDLDPRKLNALRERAQQIQRLKKKYGGSLLAVIEKRAELQAKLGFEENFSQILEAKRQERELLRTEMARIAKDLQCARQAIAERLAPQIVTALKDLGIDNALFEARMSVEAIDKVEGPLALRIEDEWLHANARGVDVVEFYVSTNKGEHPKPLTRVASGGEISRIMLALKTILAKNDKLPLLVFDEIDVGISGRIAQRVGRAMKRLAAEHQIIAITHLAQIAAAADVHFVVEKRSTKDTTSSQLRRLSTEEHVVEIARLISGDNVSDSSVESARTLITEATATEKKLKKQAA
jgi:DNA repair protein RecN (Recombination protein N)